MTTISADAKHRQLCCCSPATGDSDLPELLRRVREHVAAMRAGDGPESATSPGPSDLALTVVTEALAIGEAMSRIAVDEASGDGANPGSPAIYKGIDSRFVEHRARALRSALHGIDDYVWWGALAGNRADGLTAATG